MTNRNSSNINVPEARDAMDKFKMEAASEVGVNLKNGYNGDLTSREAGSVGGQMVKKMIESYERNMKRVFSFGTPEAKTGSCRRAAAPLTSCYIAKAPRSGRNAGLRLCVFFDHIRSGAEKPSRSMHVSRTPRVRSISAA